MSDTLLITGGAGFIGSAFTGLAADAGYFPLVLDKLTYAGSRANLAYLPENAYRLVVGDIGDEALLAELLFEHQPSGIVHFAAESHVDNSISGPETFIDTNITGTYRLLQSALAYWRDLPDEERTRFRFVNISTDEVYGALPLDGKDRFTEDSPFAPNSPYSASKASADHLARAWWKTYGLPVITTHCSNNYGPRQHPEKLIPRMIHCALAGDRLPVYGDGRHVRDWIHVEDHCAGVMLAYRRGAPGEIYNFGGDAESGNLALVKQLCALLDQYCPRSDGARYETQIRFVPDRPGHDERYAIDDAKAVRELAFGRKYTLADGLAETVRWYLANGPDARGKT